MLTGKVAGARGDLRPTPARRTVAPALLLALLAFGLYANALWNGFVFDDVHLIQDNEAITSVRYIPEIFTENLWGVVGKSSNYYRPLAPLFYMLVHQAFGLAPWAFHLLVILFHAGACAVVYLLLTRLAPADDDGSAGTRWLSPAFLAALIFAAHPIHTEAVAWNAGIMDVSCTFFVLLAFLLHLRGRREGLGAPASIGALISFFLATLCKEPALTLPVVILAFEWVEEGRGRRAVRSALSQAWPYVAVLVVYLALRGVALRGFAPYEAAAPLSWTAALRTAPALFAMYIWKLILPVGLNVMHSVAPVSTLWSWRAAVGLAVVTAFAALLVVSATRSRRVFLGLLFVAVPLAPALYLPALSQGQENAFAERYLYFASFGLALIVAVVLARLVARSRRLWRVAVTVTLATAAVLSAATIQRNRVWRDNLTLWSDAVTKSPQSAAVHENLGYALYYAGRSAEGRRELDLAVQLDPHLTDKIVWSGVQYARKGLLKKALVVFETALLLQPDSPDVHYNLAVTYQAQGWVAPAIEHYRRALALQPDLADAQINLGSLLGQQGQVDEAILHLEKAVQLRPRDPAARLNLAQAYQLKGWTARADEQRRLAGPSTDSPSAR